MGRALFALCILLVCAPACLADLYWQSSFNTDTVGSPTPQLWTQVNAPAPSIVDATTPDIVTYGDPDQIARCVRLSEVAASSGTAPRQSIYRGFPWQIAGPTGSGGTGGTLALEFDVRFGSRAEHNEGFMVRLCGHDATSSDPTNGRTWGVGLLFAGDTSYDAAGSPYGLQIQTNRFTQVFSQLRDASNNPITYDPSAWYTVKIEADMVNQKCRFWFAAKGQTLANVTATSSNPDGWRDWMSYLNASGGIPAGTKVNNLHNAIFFLSRQKTTEGTLAKVFVDNVKLSIPQDPAVSSSLESLRLADNGAFVQTNDAIVTCAPGVVGSTIYIQDNSSGGAGIRVFTDQSAIALGDKVSVKGYMRQASDNGLAVAHVGEREFVASTVTVTSSNNALPKPVTLTNKNLGGGWLGPNETVSPGPEPRLKGVWPSNTTGDKFYFGNESANLFSPLFNVGTLVSVTGKVVKRLVSYEADPGNPLPTNLYPYDIYISDGSLADDGWRDSARGVTDAAHPAGIRIRMSKDVFTALDMLYGDYTGQYVTVVGIACATSGTDLTPSANGGLARNIRGVRLRASTDLTFIW